MRVAFISGTSIVNLSLFSAWGVKSVETKHGEVKFKLNPSRIRSS